MEYKRFGNIVIARIDKGEEIVGKIREISLSENIKLASVQAIGAVGDFTVGLYNTEKKEYCSRTWHHEGVAAPTGGSPE